MVLAKNIITASSLRNISVAYDTPEFVASQVFPLLDVNDVTAKITKFEASDYFRNDAKHRSEGARAARGKFKTSEVTYSCTEVAFAHAVTDDLRRNSKKLNAQPLMPDMEAVEMCKRKIMMEREGKVASLITSGTWADGVAGGSDAEGNWAKDAGTNTFKTDIDAAKQALRDRGIASSSKNEIRLLVDDATFDQIIEIDRIRDQFKYVSKESITPEMLAGLLKIDKVIIAQSIYNSAKETKAGTEFTSARFWQINSGKGMAFLYAYPKFMAPKMMTAGLMVRDRFDSQEGGGFERIMKWREDAEHQDVYEVAENRDQIQIAAPAGYLFKDTIAT